MFCGSFPNAVFSMASLRYKSYLYSINHRIDVPTAGNVCRVSLPNSIQHPGTSAEVAHATGAAL